jgi:hypothetical protein
MGIAEQICDAPVYGPIGLAIKSFMFAYEVNLYDEFAEDGCGDRVCAIGRLNPDGDNYGCRSDPKTGEYKKLRRTFPPAARDAWATRHRLALCSRSGTAGR